MPRRDRSLVQQANVRAALRMRLGERNWINVERVLPIAHSTLAEIVAERQEVSSTIAYRVALALNVPMQDVISGAAIPPGTCRHCGRERV